MKRKAAFLSHVVVVLLNKVKLKLRRTGARLEILSTEFCYT